MLIISVFFPVAEGVVFNLLKSPDQDLTRDFGLGAVTERDIGLRKDSELSPGVTPLRTRFQ